MHKSLLLFIMISVVLLTGCGKKQPDGDDLSKILRRGKLIAGVRTDTKPFGFIDENNVHAGYDIDIAKIIAAAVLGDDNKIEFVNVTASDRIRKLITNEVDILVATISITDQRREILDFSIPYYIAGQAMMLPAESNIISLKELSGKKVIIVYGSTGEHSIRTSIPNVIVTGYKTYDEAYNALKSGKADALIADDTLLYRYTLSDPSVKLLPKRYSKEYYAVALRKDAASQRLLIRINSVLQNLQTSGRLKILQTKWGIK